LQQCTVFKKTSTVSGQLRLQALYTDPGLSQIKSKYFNEAENFTGHKGSNDR